MRLSKTAAALFAGFVFIGGIFHAGAFEAGAAKVEITPPVGTPLNGYSDRMGRGAIAVHDPVWSRALFISDGKTSVLLVSADLCLINRELRDRVLELAPPDVPKENIFLSATHTHSAQGGMDRALVARAVAGPFRPDTLETTARKIVESIRNAMANRKRATIGYSVTAQDSLTENRQVPGGPVDPQIGVVRVDDSDGNPIAIIANMAAHPTTVGGADKFSISADFPGFFYTAVESQTGEGCVAMFVNGAEGNQRPANPENLSGWAHTKWVGDRLAAIVMESAGKITCGEAELRVNRSTPDLPPCVAPFMPASTVLATLEINGLLLTFVPGEPCVEIGLELRRLARQRGYDAQFTVGLSNDYLLYFVPRSLYATPSYECAMNAYGPAIDQWLYRQYQALMMKDGKPADATAPAPASKLDIQNGIALQLNGSFYDVGYQHGAALAAELRNAFHVKVVSPCADGTWIPKTGLWALAPPFIDVTPLAVPRLAVGVRPMLGGLGTETMETLRGIADGSKLPFDAVWLMQCVPTIAASESIDAVYGAPFCTMLALSGQKAGDAQILVGRNFDWPAADTPVVFDVDPAGGMRYVQVGFASTAGAYTGMNEAGLALAVERVETLGTPALAGPPIEMVLHEALVHDRSVAEVLARLESAPYLRGYHVLIADAIADNARVVELGEQRITRLIANGILLGVNPSAVPQSDTDMRYLRLYALAGATPSISADKLARMLADVEPGRTGQQTILNGRTRHSVVMEPRYKRIVISLPGSDGKLGAPLTISLRKSAS